ncbi:MAG: 3-hydroxyacyl-CoA dehydrogenase/enoyl-CoA hydratase family protein [Bryobacterales bacterium]|nr:3-hydroxyacyl-CoA dehydrogenase/enoyl-CoA hydratase family protein [Bryobacterales bacterium]
MRTIKRVAVLGAGTMGARIAAHFANAGIPVLLLDIVDAAAPDRNAVAKKGIEAARKQKPGAFFTDAAIALVQPGNFEDDLALLAECDWIVEAVVENLEIKQALFRKVEKVRREDAIVSTNTSGIPLAQLTAEFSPAMRRMFLGTHFFNPPRYLYLVEVIPTPDTDPDVIGFVSGFCGRRLGKGVVPCKDTPNFIANRLGSFWGGTVTKLTVEGGFTVEEVDALTGGLIGLPNSASFRLLDIVGVDVWAYVGKNLASLAAGDPWRDRFEMPAFLEEMLKRRMLGEKSGQGFYRRAGKGQIEALDLQTFEYKPQSKPVFADVEQARMIDDLPGRLRALVLSKDRAGAFLWRLFSDYCLYAAERIPEIADRVVEMDRAMRWGYGHSLGPFELWDALGFEATARRMENEGKVLPSAVVDMLSQGLPGFYRSYGKEYFDFAAREYKPVEPRPGVTVLRSTPEIKRNAGASLLDLGDGVLCLEFHSKMNTLGEDSFAMMYQAVEELAGDWEALVIGNQGTDFTAGANLMLVLMGAREGDWDELSLAIHRFQHANMALKYAPKPVVVAPFNRTLGGGCEIALHATRVQASAELYMGLVEVGVGLIPAGGGCKELILRWNDPKRAFEQIGFAKVSTSAEDARQMGLLTPQDCVSMNRDRLIGDAKALALSLAPTYVPRQPRQDIPVSGESGYALMKMGAWIAHQGGYITDYDKVVAEKLAHVLSGGRLTGEQKVSEEYLLGLEREAFLSLCGDQRTQARMEHMLKTGKPLRN